MPQLSIRLPETPLTVTPEQFAAIAVENPDLRLERTAAGELIVNPPTGDDTGRRNANLIADLTIWARQYGGVVYDSSTGFRLPSGAIKSPDAAWIEQSRYDALSDHCGYVATYPDFIIELRSDTDPLPPLQDKMCEFISNGTRLGWLIDPKLQRVEIYRPEREVEILEHPRELSDETVLPGFILPMAQILV